MFIDVIKATQIVKGVTKECSVKKYRGNDLISSFKLTYGGVYKVIPD
ncbi:hypothetical protein GCM10008018_59110 [Paenibacillus marchantiophytorum]|uniref:Uncharacterized protein n=1 Tax=Paenibacillus marchantiophytorum TaxID=1619310 RepID=A0ABQ1FB40_9BACL|nr:hypothetical protein GCM10008018_59110 [Paenibacillus marchantiophytorum]